MEAWALLVSVLAFVASGAALLIARWQLVLQRDAAGGRGIGLGVGRFHRTVARRGGVETITDDYHVEVELIGNERHMVAVHLERDGRQLGPTDVGWVESPDVRRRMTCESEPLVWRFELSPDDAQDLWVVLTWVSPYGNGIRTDGLRRRLDVLETDIEEWHWFRFFGARRRFEAWGSRRRWGWARRWLSKPRRLDEWRSSGARELAPVRVRLTRGSTRGMSSKGSRHARLSYLDFVVAPCRTSTKSEPANICDHFVKTLVEQGKHRSDNAFGGDATQWHRQVGGIAPEID